MLRGGRTRGKKTAPWFIRTANLARTSSGAAVEIGSRVTQLQHGRKREVSIIIGRIPVLRTKIAGIILRWFGGGA